MEFLSEDPTYAAVVLGVLAALFLGLLRVTQQGKHLVYAGVALALLAAVMLIEWVWVTENERIEATIYALAAAVEARDADHAAEFLAPECELEPTPDRANIVVRIITSRFAGPITRERLAQELSNYSFDYLRVARLQANAGTLSGRGKAECVIHISARRLDPTAFYMTPPNGMGWSFGLRETEPHVWKVTRITPGRLDTN